MHLVFIDVPGFCGGQQCCRRECDGVCERTKEQRPSGGWTLPKLVMKEASRGEVAEGRDECVANKQLPRKN